MPACSIVEVLFVLGVAATVGGAALPTTAAALDDVQTAAGVRYVAARLNEVRVTAVKQSRDVAVAFTPANGSYEFTTYADGNRNGVRTRDIQSGIDMVAQPAQRLRDHVSGVEFATAPDLPAVDPGGTPPGSDPVHIGAANMVVFTPLGTATAGSLYVRGRRGAQYVIRVFAETGKIRILRFNPRSRSWIPL